MCLPASTAKQLLTLTNTAAAQVEFAWQLGVFEEGCGIMSGRLAVVPMSGAKERRHHCLTLPRLQDPCFVHKRAIRNKKERVFDQMRTIDEVPTHNLRSSPLLLCCAPGRCLGAWRGPRVPGQL